MFNDSSRAAISFETTHLETQNIDLPAMNQLSALESADLLQGQKSVCILHNGQSYRLQATKLGKLILTK